MTQTVIGGECSGKVWEYLVSDFLETGCQLSIDESNLLLHSLRQEKIRAEAIEIFPCFFLQGRAVLICADEPMEECWLYFPKTGRIVRRAVDAEKSKEA